LSKNVNIAQQSKAGTIKTSQLMQPDSPTIVRVFRWWNKKTELHMRLKGYKLKYQVLCFT